MNHLFYPCKDTVGEHAMLPKFFEDVDVQLPLFNLTSAIPIGNVMVSMDKIALLLFTSFRFYKIIKTNKAYDSVMSKRIYDSWKTGFSDGESIVSGKHCKDEGIPNSFRRYDIVV